MISAEQQIFNQIEKSQNILISFPVDWNGDAISSALAFYWFLKKMGKNVEIAAAPISDTKSRAFSFLPGFSDIKNSLDNLAKFIVSLNITNAKVDQIKYVVSDKTLDFIISPKDGWFTKDDVETSTSGYKYDLIITLNTPDLESLGKIYDNDVDFFYKTTIINIDHHPANEEFGQVNFVELNAVSVTEVLFEIFRDYNEKLIDEDIATCLLAGIIYKTKSFKTPNLTPHSLTTTSELIKLGARREEIVTRLYRSRDLPVLKLWGRVLNNLNGLNDNQLLWSSLFQNDFAETGSVEDNLLEVIDELIINIPQAKLITIFYSLTENPLAEEKSAESKETIVVHKDQAESLFKTKAIIYAVRNVNATELVQEFNPSGGRKIAYLSSSKPLSVFRREITDVLQNKLDKLGS
ncbi:MAG: DHH family phosphoesterase [Patescibacteria group bacterium]|jgi:nanoRNase/pAp phosphatase (c-di-AMP/oligoRNAs hydrolase)